MLVCTGNTLFGVLDSRDKVTTRRDERLFSFVNVSSLFPAFILLIADAVYVVLHVIRMSCTNKYQKSNCQWCLHLLSFLRHTLDIEIRAVIALEVNL